MNSLASRKFIVTMASLISASVLVYLKAITGEVYSSVMILTAGAYIAGNVVQKIKEMK